MTGKATGKIAGVLPSYDFSAFETITGVGGGRGHLLTATLQATPRAHGVLFDLPHATADAQAAGVESERLRVQPGDFFSDTLPSAIRYLIVQVIHDWDDLKVARILAGIRKAAATGAKLLFIECTSRRIRSRAGTKTLDRQMLTLLSGRQERTHHEYSECDELPASVWIGRSMSACRRGS